MGKKIVTFGEVMMRLAPPGYQRFLQAGSFDVTYAGGEANAENGGAGEKGAALQDGLAIFGLCRHGGNLME